MKELHDARADAVKIQTIFLAAMICVGVLVVVMLTCQAIDFVMAKAAVTAPLK